MFPSETVTTDKITKYVHHMPKWQIFFCLIFNGPQYSVSRYQGNSLFDFCQGRITVNEKVILLLLRDKLYFTNWSKDGAREGLKKWLPANVFKQYQDKVILSDLKNALKTKSKNNNNNNNKSELQSSCHRFWTRVNTVKETFWRNCLEVSRKRMKEEQRWCLGKCLNWVTVTICYGKRAIVKIYTTVSELCSNSPVQSLEFYQSVLELDVKWKWVRQFTMFINTVLSLDIPRTNLSMIHFLRFSTL